MKNKKLPYYITRFPKPTFLKYILNRPMSKYTIEDFTIKDDIIEVDYYHHKTLTQGVIHKNDIFNYFNDIKPLDPESIDEWFHDLSSSKIEKYLNSLNLEYNVK